MFVSIPQRDFRELQGGIKNFFRKGSLAHKFQSLKGILGNCKNCLIQILFSFLVSIPQRDFRELQGVSPPPHIYESPRFQSLKGILGNCKSSYSMGVTVFLSVSIPQRDFRELQAANAVISTIPAKFQSLKGILGNCKRSRGLTQSHHHSRFNPSKGF